MDNVYPDELTSTGRWRTKLGLRITAAVLWMIALILLAKPASTGNYLPIIMLCAPVRRSSILVNLKCFFFVARNLTVGNIGRGVLPLGCRGEHLPARAQQPSRHPPGRLRRRRPHPAPRLHHRHRHYGCFVDRVDERGIPDRSEGGGRGAELDHWRPRPGRFCNVRVFKQSKVSWCPIANMACRIIRFCLFVMACIETHKYNKAVKRAFAATAKVQDA